MARGRRSTRQAQAQELLSVTVKGAARMTSIGETTLRKRIEAGQIRVLRVGRKIVIPIVELRRWQEREAAAFEPSGAGHGGTQ